MARIPQIRPPAVQRDRSIFVGKHGSDTYSGLTVDTPKLTIAAALAAASALTPSESAPVMVQILDAGVYAENITVPSWVVFDAPAARIDAATSDPTLTLGANTFIDVRDIRQAVGTVAIQIATGTVDLRARSITGPTAWNVAAPASLNVFVDELSGTRVETGTVNGVILSP